MSLENAEDPQGEPKRGIEDADALVNANEDILGTAFKTGRKKPRLSSLVPPTTNLSTFQKAHSAAMTQVEARLNESEQRLYTLEAVVGDAPEEAPQSSLRSCLGHLASQFASLDERIATLEASSASHSQEVAHLKRQVLPPPPRAPLQSTLESETNSIRKLRSDIENFRHTLLEIVSMVERLSRRAEPSPQPPPTSIAHLEQRFTPITLFTSEIGNIKALVAALEKRVEVSFGGFTFKTLHDCKEFLISHSPSKGQAPIYHCMTTLNSLLQAIGDEVVTEQASSLEELTQHKTGKTPAQSRTLASLKSRTPSFLSRTREANDDISIVDPMTAMSSFEAWDKQDGITGLVPRALAAYRSTYPTLEETIKTTCEGYPVATMVFLEMLATSFLFMEKWFSKTTTFYLRTLHNTYQGPLFTAEQKKSTWDLTKILTKVLFGELSKASSCARAAPSDDPFTLNSLVLWATVQHHAIMKAFKEHDFEGHPEVQPKVLDFLGRNAAPKQSIDDLKRQLADVMSTLNTVSSLAKQAKTVADKALSTAGAAGGGRRQNQPAGRGTPGGRGAPGGEQS
jgi:hypothetical protein